MWWQAHKQHLRWVSVPNSEPKSTKSVLRPGCWEMIIAFWVVGMSYTGPFSWDLLLPRDEQRGCNGQGGLWQSKGFSSQQDPRFAPMGSQLQWCSQQRLVSWWWAAHVVQSGARACRSCWAAGWSCCAFGKDQFSQVTLRVPWKSVGGGLLFWCIDVWCYCRKDKDLRLEVFFTFAPWKWGSWMPSLDFLFAKQPQLTLSTGIIVSSHHFWKMGH